MPKQIIIISGGRLGDTAFYQKRLAGMRNSLIVCCDSGVRHADKLNIKPDVIIGDMDSIAADELERRRASGTKVLRYPANKDATDTQLALEYALELKPAAIEIWGALGGRVDHALANLFLLDWSKEASIKLIDECCEAFIVRKKAFFSNAAGQTVSLFALDDNAEGVKLGGFQYPPDDAKLAAQSPRGISNVIVAKDAAIEVRAGRLLVIHFWRKDIFPEAD